MPSFVRLREGVRPVVQNFLQEFFKLFRVWSKTAHVLDDFHLIVRQLQGVVVAVSHVEVADDEGEFDELGVCEMALHLPSHVVP